jgi:hypothetical protein
MFVFHCYGCCCFWFFELDERVPERCLCCAVGRGCIQGIIGSARLGDDSLIFVTMFRDVADAGGLDQINRRVSLVGPCSEFSNALKGGRLSMSKATHFDLTSFGDHMVIDASTGKLLSVCVFVVFGMVLFFHHAVFLVECWNASG